MSNESINNEEQKPVAEESAPVIETSEEDLDTISGARAVPLYGVIPT